MYGLSLEVVVDSAKSFFIFQDNLNTYCSSFLDLFL